MEKTALCSDSKGGGNVASLLTTNLISKVVVLLTTILIFGCASPSSPPEPYTQGIYAFACTERYELIKHSREENILEHMKTSPNCIERLKIKDEAIDWERTSQRDGIYGISGTLKDNSIFEGWRYGIPLSY